MSIGSSQGRNLRASNEAKRERASRIKACSVITCSKIYRLSARVRRSAHVYEEDEGKMKGKQAQVRSAISRSRFCQALSRILVCHVYNFNNIYKPHKPP